MKNMKSAISVDALLHEIKRLTFSRDGAGIDMAYPSDAGFPSWLNTTPTIQAAVAEIEELARGKATHLMLNKLQAGDHVLPHSDYMDTGERWHLVITTNPGAWWNDPTNGDVHMEEGSWWGPVPYNTEHSVWNDGETERIHLVVDVRR